MAKPDACFFFEIFLIFIFFYHVNIAEQIFLDMLETVERDSYVWWLYLKEKKKQNIGSLYSDWV